MPRTRATIRWSSPSFDLSVSFATWRQNPAFVDATLVTLEAPPNQMGDYHLHRPGVAGGRPGCGIQGRGQRPERRHRRRGTTGDAGFDSGADELPGPPPAPDTLLYFSTRGQRRDPGRRRHCRRRRHLLLGRHGLRASLRRLGRRHRRRQCRHRRDPRSSTRTPSTCPSRALHACSPARASCRDEDIVLYDAGNWSTFFDGSDVGVSVTALEPERGRRRLQGPRRRQRRCVHGRQRQRADDRFVR